MDNAQRAGFGNTADVKHTDGEVKTFWRFDRTTIAGGGVSLKLRHLADFKNGTETTVPIDWPVLYRDAYQVRVDAGRRELSLKAIGSIAPNLAHWSKESDLQTLLDQCSGADDDGESNTRLLDRLGRRKRIPLKDFIDNLMADRLGLGVETIRSYRQRATRRMK